LKIETQYLENHQVQLTVEFEPEFVDQAKRQAARNIARRTKIPGFRPGKAPYHIVQRFVGDEIIFEESIKVLITEHYPSIIDQAEIEPYGPGNLEKVVSKDPLILEFTVPLQPVVQLGDYRSIRIPYSPPVVSEEEIDRVIEQLRENVAIEEPVARPIQPGDRVYIKISAKRTKTDDLPDVTIIRERNYSLIIPLNREEQSNEWPFPGFSQELIGLNVGDEKTITYTYPEDTEYTTLRNRTVDFFVHIDEVKSRNLPELNDEFIQTIWEGKFETLEDFRKDVREKLEKIFLDRYNEEYNEKIMDEILSISTVKYPPQMLEEEMEEVLESLVNRLQSEGLTLETYLKSRGMNESEFREKIKPDVETQLKKSLALYEISKAENISISESEIKSEAQKTVEALNVFYPEQISDKPLPKNLLEKIAIRTGVNLIMNRTYERLRAIAMGQNGHDAPQTEHLDEGEIGTSRVESDTSINTQEKEDKTE
jgi:trigger factor